MLDKRECLKYIRVMKLLKSTTKLPRIGRGKYVSVHSKIWEKARRMKPGRWLPIKCKNLTEVVRINNATRRNGETLFETAMRRDMLYIRVQQENQNENG